MCAPPPFRRQFVAELDPGDKSNIWYFDGSPMYGAGEWRVAGAATISADGTQVITDPGPGIPRFCGVCGLISTRCPELPEGGNPLSFRRLSTDFIFPDQLLRG